jgi:hypothetical protein
MIEEMVATFGFLPTLFGVVLICVAFSAAAAYIIDRIVVALAEEDEA